MGYIRARLTQAVVTVWGVITLTYFLESLIPGGPIDFLRQDMRENPAKYQLPRNPSDEEITETIEEIVKIPPDAPLHQQYVEYLYNLLIDGNFGNSYIIAAGVDVLTLILDRAPWTIFLSVIGLIYGLLLGILLGTLMAYYEGTKFDIGMTVSMIIDSAIPYYAAAIFLLFFLAFQLGWFPTGGRMNPDTTPGLNWPWISGVFYHAALPSLSFIVTGFGGGALGMRANAIRLLGSEYIHNARLRGLSQYRIAIAHLGRNAVLPMYTSVITGLGGLLGGAVILEQIFAYPGMGLLMLDAATMRDFPVLMGAVVITTALFVLGTLIVDFTYPLIDPRADVKVSRE